jgi:hypothetical protein
VEDFRKACKAGDAAGALRLLGSIEDDAAKILVERIGGPRAMVRFLVQRRHILHVWETPSFDAWLRDHLREAEPMHLLDVSVALQLAADAGFSEIVRRLKAHLKFTQPPDPTRWSRKINTPAEAAFLQACEDGEPEPVRAALIEDASLVHAINKWGQDGLALLGAYGCERSNQVVPILCDAGIRKSAAAMISAAFWGAVPIVEALIAHDVPLRQHIDDDALWTAAVATRVNNLDVAELDQIASMLVGAGADANATNRWGTTVWGSATAEARPILERLGAEPREKGEARYDRDSGCSGFIEGLVRGEVIERDELDLNEAAAANDVERVRHLLAQFYCLKPNLRGHGSPERPLHIAAYFDNQDVAKSLIEYGYSPGAVSSAFIDGSHVGPPETWGKSVVAVAAARGHEKLVDILMNNVDFFQGRRARRK